MRVILLLLFFILIYIVNCPGQKSMSLFDTLYVLEDVKITLTYPFDSLYRTKRDEIEAQISIETSKGPLIQNAPMTINLRGKFRRMKCEMPPLQLNLKKSTLKDLELNDVDEVKLVTHCMEGTEGQENLQEELLCYQIYEVLSPMAYRTIWITVQYRNTFNPQEVIDSKGFLLEPDKDITARLNIMEKKVYNVSEDSLHFESYSSTAAFNFLIGNRDWSIISSRNAKLFYDSIQSQYIVIPYDFDFANIVGASYRREVSGKNIIHPFDRMYEGEYFTNKAGEILKDFETSRDTIISIVGKAENPMDENRRKKITRYFETWFEQVQKSNLKNLGYGTVFPYKGGL